MANEVEKFDPSKLMDGVKDRIRATFVSLIPDNAWEEMVKTEINKFFSPSDGLNSYHTRDPKHSHFTKVVFEVLNAEAEKKIKAILTDPEFSVENTYTGNSNGTVSELLRGEIIKRAPEIFAAVLENSIAQTIQRMKNYQ